MSKKREPLFLAMDGAMDKEKALTMVRLYLDFLSEANTGKRKIHVRFSLLELIALPGLRLKPRKT